MSVKKLSSVPYLVSLAALLVIAGLIRPAQAQSGRIDGGVEQEAGPVNILFVLDASYSMKEKLSGEMKMTAAKEVLQNALSRIPNSVNLGLRVFGQSYSNLADIDCRQTALLVPIGQHNRGAIIKSIRQIEPFGMTPIMFALRQAAEEDFRGVMGPKTVILITDGADTCGGDPCAYLTMLRAHGIRMKVDVVGVDLAREKAAREQLKCITAVSLGKYYEANSSTQLIEGIGSSVDAAISGKVLPKVKTDEPVSPESKPDGKADEKPDGKSMKD
ncbi:MAG: VWA domain-containing protein [Candidatus Melainabacteria bacterium]|nr:VWA domain-containing protein [Candidatus Melainabacteria bacterium]